MNNVTRRVMELVIPGTRRTRTPQEDMVTTGGGRHDGRGCYPGCGPRPEGVEKKENADPYDIEKGHQGEHKHRSLVVG